MMYFTKATLKRGAVRDRQYSEVLKEGYATHELVWDLFRDDSNRKRDFLYRWNLEGEIPTVFAVSKRPPLESNFFQAETIPYAPKLVGGDLFEFSLLANAVVKKRNDKKQQTRHDVVLEYKRQNEIKCDAEAALLAGRAWLDRQSERFGFRVHDIGFKVNQHNTRTFKKRRGGDVTLSTLDFEGVLECTDASGLEEALFNGVGPAKGYGCGLLMLRRLRM
jgi:CRISPR system Cascade subunit CasE